MFKIRNLFSLALLLIVAITLIVAACSPALPPPSRSNATGGLEISPILRPYYRDLGGEPILGPAISTSFILNGAECQYTTNVLLCHDPESKSPDGYFLAPRLVDEPRVVLDGIAVDESFLTLYQKLGGAQQCGQPISPVQTIPESGRVQQRFEKVGLYRSLNDPQDKARLLPYGAQSCGRNCAASVENVHPEVVIQTPFTEFLAQMAGSADIFGEPLSEPYLADDSHLEQVYAAVLVTAPLDRLDEIDLKPLPVMLGMPAAAPSEQVYGLEQNMDFYQVAGSLGYHIPVFFSEFINQHGGMEVSGRPLAEPVTIHAENLARQCFENYCLDYHLEKEAPQAVSLTSLGKQYLDKINLEEIIPYHFPRDNYLLQVGELKLSVSSGSREIYAMVFNKQGSQPVAGIAVLFTVSLPDNSQVEYLTPPTDENGFTMVEIAPITGTKNSALVSYQACLNLPLDKPVCTSDAFMIWNMP